jgi:hypothetical protein
MSVELTASGVALPQLEILDLTLSHNQISVVPVFEQCQASSPAVFE